MSDNESNVGDGIIATVIDSELLISEVEKKPALYNKQLKEYSDRNVKEKLWVEVCGVVISNWNALSAEQKKSKGSEVQKKWRNLKDCFQREMTAQRKTVSGQGAKKRRKYVHFGAMLFLMPFVSGRQTSSNVSCSVNSEDNERPRVAISSNEDGNASNASAVVPQPRQVINSKKSNASAYENKLLNILQTKQSDEFNEDKCFASMLVPMMLGKLNEEQKHFAKVEILNVMRNARYFQVQPNVGPFARPQPMYGQWPSTSGQTSTQNLYTRPEQGYGLEQSTYRGQNENQDSFSSQPGSYQGKDKPGQMQFFYNDFAASVVSPSSTSGSELYDLSNL